MILLDKSVFYTNDYKSTVLDCAHYLHIDPKNIRETIKGNQTQSKGYTFKLKGAVKKPKK